jgi:hypothetical protein
MVIGGTVITVVIVVVTNVTETAPPAVTVLGPPYSKDVV